MIDRLYVNGATGRYVGGFGSKRLVQSSKLVQVRPTGGLNMFRAIPKDEKDEASFIRKCIPQSFRCLVLWLLLEFYHRSHQKKDKKE